MTALIVPVDVAALCVTPADVTSQSPYAQGLAPAADFSQLPYVDDTGAHNQEVPYLSHVALGDGEPFMGAVPLSAGIHLHWALPDGLTHGHHPGGEHERVRFPCAPDRWLVTRILLGGPNGLTIRSWVLESDLLSTTANVDTSPPQPTVPLAPGSGQNFRYLGGVFDLEHWTERSTTVQRYSPLTAVGYGEPTFASCYRNCSAVFGFLDAVADLPPSATVAYHVAGWYAARGADPLADASDQAGRRRLRWAWPDSAEPTATVCNGVISGIPWEANTRFLTDGPGDLDVAIGNTAGEALAALLARKLGSTYAGVEHLLDALQLGLLNTQGGTGSLAGYDAARHKAGFSSMPGGRAWTPTAAAASAAKPGAYGGDLDDLAKAQRALEDLDAELAARRRQLFLDWQKYLVVARDPTDLNDSGLAGRADDVQAFVQDAHDALATTAGTRTERLAEVQKALAKVHATLGQHGLTAPHTAPRYYQPNDPVVLLSGLDATPPPRYGHDGEQSPGRLLPCRLEQDVVTTLTASADLVTGSAACTVTARTLPGLASLPAGAPALLLQSLVHEAAVLAPSSAAAVLAAVGGADNPAVLDHGATLAALRQAVDEFVSGGDPVQVAYVGAAPAPLMLATWTTTPWLPVSLHFDVGFAPVQPAGSAGYPTDVVDSNCRLDPGTGDLTYIGPVPRPADAYQGIATLSHAATVDMVNEIERQLRHPSTDHDELASIAATLASLPLLAQRLTGLLEAMLTQAPTLQLPVADPQAPDFGPANQFVRDVATAVAHDRSVAPLSQGAFNPLRSGALTINRLWIVDAFGRFRDFATPSQVVVAEALRPPAHLQLPAGTAFLAPRIAQPSRLRMRMLHAADDDTESNADPATSPIAGWVLPVLVDRTLGVYAADGRPLGELTSVDAGETTLWTPAPGGAAPPRTRIQDVMEAENPHLRDFALAMHADGSGPLLAALLDTLASSLALTLPGDHAQDAESAVLFGHALALVRLEVTLELLGPPASDNSWDAFRDSILNDAPPRDAGLTEVRFPVVLGDRASLQDGLAAYWLDVGGAADYATLQPPASGPHVPGAAPLSLTLAPGDSHKATLLLGPHGSVRATTGILPAKTIRIPDVHRTPGQRALSPVLAVRPLLLDSASGPLSLPLPQVNGVGWSWVSTSGDAWVTRTVSDGDAQARMPGTAQRIAEGWLRLDPTNPTSDRQ